MFGRTRSPPIVLLQSAAKVPDRAFAMDCDSKPFFQTVCSPGLLVAVIDAHSPATTVMSAYSWLTGEPRL